MSQCPHCFSQINMGATKCPNCTGNIVYDNSLLVHWKKAALIGAVGVPILDMVAGTGIGIFWSLIIGAAGGPILLFVLTQYSGRAGS